jgi:localization factor PodJL
MARAYHYPEISDEATEPQPGEWQALRGELVALLDQVEGRYARDTRPDPAFNGLTRRVRNLRDQVVGPEPAVRRREALRTVKRAVDRFTDRHEPETIEDERDDLTSAIAEIRGRQISAPAAALGRRASDMPEFRELSALVGGLSGRLERLEVELKSQRASNGNVREVAAQVEQLTHVVELLAGAVGETGQVKRLEAQIAALGALIEEGPKVDLTTINRRLDDVSTTVGKLAELQAQQMEREIIREDRAASTPSVIEAVGPSMHAIEKSVRNVYDRIDSIEKNVALSSNDFERLTSEMAAFIQAMEARDAAPNVLVGKVDAIAARIGDLDASNSDVAGLRDDIASLREAVMAGMEPRFLRIENQIDALADRIAPALDTSQVESQLKQLMARMDETGAQLNGLANLYATAAEPTDLEAMATLVAERTSDAVTRKAPAPVAMFGPESLKSIEDRISGLIKSAGKTPDYEALADMVAERTYQAVAKSSPAPTQAFSEDGMAALEQRMAALFNTAGKDTAERLTRLEAALEERQERAATPVPRSFAALHTDDEDQFDDRMRSDAAQVAHSHAKAGARSDAMPANPADEAPLLDPGFKDLGPVRAALGMGAASRPQSVSEPVAPLRPAFDPSGIERPARPQSSLGPIEDDPFAAPAPVSTPPVEVPVNQSSTSTFVAAARRAQRARQEAATPATPSTNSLISRAMARVRPGAAATAPVDELGVQPVTKPEKPAKPARAVKEKKSKPVEAPVAPAFGVDAEGDIQEPRQSFLVRHRRPLLLAATLVAVSMLALNLVMQRMAPARTPPAPAPVAEPVVEQPSATPAADADVPLVAPQARVIDLVDNTPTAAIGPGVPMSFSQSASSAPMPALLLPLSAGDATGVQIPADLAPEAAPALAEAFELPPEGVGPLELRQAAADGDARAQFEIAAIYTEGRAVPQDYAEAAKWYERSAAQGFVPAQYRIGNLYEAGQGVEQDFNVAKVWYQRGADAGHRMAMHNLAALYASGQLGDQEFSLAAEWFGRAAALGMTDSQFNLGMLHARGLGVEQDFEQSYKWFSLAAINGDADAAKARDDIAKSLSADAVSRVAAELKLWKAEPIDLAANFAPLGTWSPSFDPGALIKTRDVVSKVQIVLGKLGYDIGSPDGLAGPKTAEAIKAFERSTGMSETGAVNPRLLAVLGSQPV